MTSQAPDLSRLMEAGVAEHRFTHSQEGDGYIERREESYDCSCGHSHYAFWVQIDPEQTGLNEFRSDLGTFITRHTVHLAQVLRPVLADAWEAGRAAMPSADNPYLTDAEPEISMAVIYPPEAAPR